MTDSYRNNGLRPIDVMPATGEVHYSDRPFILPTLTGTYLLAPPNFPMQVPLLELELWMPEDVEQFYWDIDESGLINIIERYRGFVDPISASRPQLIFQLYELHRSTAIKLYNLSAVLPNQVLTGLYGSSFLTGASANAPFVNFVGPGLPNPLPEYQPRPQTLPMPPSGGGKVIQFPNKIYGPNNNKPPDNLRPLKSLIKTIPRHFPWLLVALPEDMGVVTEWQDPDKSHLHYRYIADLIFNFEIYDKDTLLATYSVRPEFINGIPSETSDIYDTEGKLIGTVAIDGSVSQINDLTEAEQKRLQLSQQFWYRILYQTYLANGGRRSFESWLALGALTTPTPDENADFVDYINNGGTLNYPDWIANGKPMKRPIRVVPEGGQYDGGTESSAGIKEKPSQKSSNLEGKTQKTNPKDIRAASKNWSPEKKAKFDLADKYYSNVGYNDYDSHLRGIDFDQPVEIIELKAGHKLYQYSYVDRLSGLPKVGAYYYTEKSVDINKLGFEVEGRRMTELTIEKSGHYLKSTAANIEDWNDSGKVFSGGEIQLFNPEAITSNAVFVE